MVIGFLPLLARDLSGGLIDEVFVLVDEFSFHLCDRVLAFLYSSFQVVSLVFLMRMVLDGLFHDDYDGHGLLSLVGITLFLVGMLLLRFYATRAWHRRVVILR